LFGVDSPKEAGVSVLLHQRYEFLNGGNFRRRFITVPSKVLTQPEDSPPAPRSNVGRLCERVCAFLPGGIPPHRPDFEEFYTLTRDPESEIEFRTNVGRWSAAFNEATHGFSNPRSFKFAESHRRPLTPRMSGADAHARTWRYIPHECAPCGS
jgi:hypothetical protein